MVAAVEQGFVQKQIEESAYRFGQSIESGDRVIVGVNKFQSKDEAKVDLFEVPEATQQRQIDKVKNIKATRDNAKVQAALKNVVEVAKGTANLMPPILEAVKAYATLGEISAALATVFGEYTESGN
jgi:methylmalonyl-CoA mutase N-terminal domain/subunit